MKRILLTLVAVFFAAASFAQIEDPVKWSYAGKKLSSTEAVVLIKATVDEGWHIYSQNLKDGGPQPTKFTFTPGTNYTLVGKTIEPKPITKYETSFKMNVGYFEKSVVFQQKVKLKGAGPYVVKGKLEFMTCNDHKCLPPDEVEFSIPIK